MTNNPLTPCAPGYHRLYPGIELCADCGALVTDAPPLLAPGQAALHARADACRVLKTVSRPDLFTQVECGALGELCRAAAETAHLYRGEHAEKVRVGFSRGASLLNSLALRWHSTSRDGHAEYRKAVIDYVGPAHRYANDWIDAEEQRTRTTSRRRAARTEG